jgi:uncharacterized HAD superfamily protein
MLIRLPIMGFDIDDVVFNSFDPIKAMFKSRYNLDMGDPPTFTLRDYCKSLTEEQYRNTIDDALAKSDIIDPIAGAIDFIEYYHSVTGYNIIFVTSRNEKMVSPTYDLLDRYFSGIPYKVFFPHNEGKRKIDIINGCGIDMFVEDRLKYCLDIATNDKLVLLHDKPWNRRFFNEKNIYKIVRFNKWKTVRIIYETFSHLF